MHCLSTLAQVPDPLVNFRGPRHVPFNIEMQIGHVAATEGIRHMRA